MEVSEDLIESLEISLNAMGRSLLRDVADVLNIPSKEMIQRIYGPGGAGSQKIKLFLESSESEPPQQQQGACKILVRHYDGAFYCGSTTKQGSQFCEKHYSTPVPLNLNDAVGLSVIQGYPDLFATPQGHVITKEGVAVGVIKDSVFYKF